MKLCRFFSGSFLFFERPAERDRFAFPSQANLPVEDHFSRGYGYEIDTFRQEIHETGCQVTLRDPIRPKINSRSRDLSSLHRFRCIRSTLSFFSNPCLLFKRISDIYIYSNFESIPVLSPEKILPTTSLSSMRIHFSDKFSNVDRFRKKISIGSLYRAGGRRMGG